MCGELGPHVVVEADADVALPLPWSSLPLLLLLLLLLPQGWRCNRCRRRSQCRHLAGDAVTRLTHALTTAGLTALRAGVVVVLTNQAFLTVFAALNDIVLIIVIVLMVLVVVVVVVVITLADFSASCANGVISGSSDGSTRHVRGGVSNDPGDGVVRGFSDNNASGHVTSSGFRSLRSLCSSGVSGSSQDSGSGRGPCVRGGLGSTLRRPNVLSIIQRRLA